MTKQRTLFFGKVPGKHPKKWGKNEPVPDRRFRPVVAGQIEVRFANTTITQFGGYPLWRKFTDDIGMSAKVAHHIKMDRGEGFTAPEISHFFVDTRILGADRLMHVDRMRYDPILNSAFGIEGLPSGATIGRYFKSFGGGHLESLERLNVRVNNQLWKKSRKNRCGPAKEGRIVLDYDSSTMTVYGKQEGADRGRCFRKKDKPGFQPKFAFIGGLGVMVNQKLYPQSWNLASEFEAFHKETVSKLPKTARIWAIRADGAVYSEDRIQWIERKRYTYAVSAKVTSHLLETIKAIPEQEWLEGEDEQGHSYSIARLRYRPKTWKEERTYVISRRLKDLKGQSVLWHWLKYKYFAYVTDYRGPLVDQFKFCVERCTLESFIKEGKNGFRYDFLPCKEFDANRAFLGHIQMGYNLFIWWKLLRAPARVNRWTIQTVRRRILNISGNLRKYMGRWVLSLPEWWPWQATYMRLALASGLPPP
jgi:hypothetical protein